MLLGAISGLSLSASVLVCALTEGFAGLGWLWILPAVFLGSFINKKLPFGSFLL